MKLQVLSPAKSLNRAYLKQSLKRDQIELFKANLARLFDRINEKETEEKLLSIFPATDTQKTHIIERVQKILANPDSSDVPRFESEIDRLVYELYELYGLTEAENAVVEGAA